MGVSKIALLDVAWDNAKAQSNLVKHGVTFAQAVMVMLDPLALTVFDEAHSDTEERWFTLGQTSEGRLLAVSHTYQLLDADTARIRLISAREATPRERQQYQNEPR
ncbi:BrnT family toxin [Candidatus Thiosymbion oneisti]|uniref:BrnT family toxin n=1 Tax=Candidatus Thiosymbion oneisti TaxID=589554 RepID=UPI001FB639F5|nr:BrnT family toxin [Candidatus Thiosymbion oneisti]